MVQPSPANIQVSSIYQVAIVVKNLQRTVENYWNILGIGPWELHDIRPPVLYGVTYHGKPAQFTLKVAFAKVGATELELIEPVSGNNIYCDFIAEYGEGLHHLLFTVDNVDQTTKIMSDSGFPLLQSGHINDGHWAYYDTFDALKAIWEAARLPRKLSPDYHYPESEKQESPAKVNVERINQIALVVKDLQIVVENYWNILGIGPWDIYSWEAPLVYDRTYHGKPAWAREKMALAQVGAVQLQLCQPIDGDSIYQDFLMEHGEGLHHLNFSVDDVDETAKILSEQGFLSLQSGRFGPPEYKGAYDHIDIKPLRAIWEPVHLGESIGAKPIRYPG